MLPDFEVEVSPPEGAHITVKNNKKSQEKSVLPIVAPKLLLIFKIIVAASILAAISSKYGFCVILSEICSAYLLR